MAVNRDRRKKPGVGIRSGSGLRVRIPKWREGQLLLQLYRVEGTLGQGGMGIVYKVRRITDDRLFAVKTLRSDFFGDLQKKKAFLRELRLWMDLPEHPNLTACLFSRTIEDRIGIFSEYVDGGSLQNWIRARRMIELDKILDIAIQTAWGIQIAHSEGVIHHDIKPSNVLMTREGTAKITDFGLANARHRAGLDSRKQNPVKSILVSSHGMTPAYCSPEQVEGKMVGKGTDIWSWGVTVLEMFTGKVTWVLGSIAEFLLNQHMARNPKPPFPAMPEKLADILRRCFREKPEERWESLAAVVDALQAVHADSTGTRYARALPGIPASHATWKRKHDTFKPGDRTWDDPLTWWARAWKSAGMKCPEPGRQDIELTGSRKALAFLDLELFEETQKVYEDLLRSGQETGISLDLIAMLRSKAKVLNYVDDFPGAVSTCEQAMAVLNEAGAGIDPNQKMILEIELLSEQASMLGNDGRHIDAIPLHHKAMQMVESIVSSLGRTDQKPLLVKIYMNLITSLFAVNDLHQCETILDRSIEILQEMVREKQYEDQAEHLATVCMNKAVVIYSFGRINEASDLLDKTIEIRKKLIEQNGRTDLVNSLASAYTNQAFMMRNLGNLPRALSLMDESIRIRKRLVLEEGNTGLAKDLAATLVNMANLMADLADYRESERLCDETINICEHLVDREGRTDLADYLAAAHMNKGVALRNLGNSEEALVYFARAIAATERIVFVEGKKRFVRDLGNLYFHRAESFRTLGDTRNARLAYLNSMKVMESLFTETKRWDVGENLLTILLANADMCRDIAEFQESLLLLDRAKEVIGCFGDSGPGDPMHPLRIEIGVSRTITLLSSPFPDWARDQADSILTEAHRFLQHNRSERLEALVARAEKLRGP